VGLQIHTAPGEAERLLIIGVTRGGKTTLAQALLSQVDSWVVFDSKRLGREWAQFAEQYGAVVSQNPADIRRHERVVLEVDTRSLTDREGWRKPGTLGYIWTEALLSVFWRQSEDGTTVALFDEAMHTLPVNCHWEALRLQTQGAGLGLPVWLETQAPLFVNTVAMSQAEHCFAFATFHAGYRKELAVRRGVDCELLGELAGPKSPDVSRRREFAHHYTGEEDWTRFEPLQLGRARDQVSEVDLGTVSDHEPVAPDPELVTLTPFEEPATLAP
jgi:hypothetical protein